MLRAFAVRASLALLALAPAALRSQAVVTGTVRSAANGDPVRLAAVRLAGGTASTLTNDAGRFRLALPPGAQRLEVRRLGFRPATVSVNVTGRGDTADVRLEPIAVGLGRVFVFAQDDAARRIIAAAIRRKQQVRGQLHDYRYEGDVRFVVRNLGKPADSASSVVLVTQTRTSAYWEQPNRYQETIVARRQTGNLAAEQNLVGVGQIVNFSQDRVPLGRFELPSPVADDALERYDYHLLDTLSVGGRRVFRLSLEPRGEGLPAFAGLIDIADSTFDVTGIDVGVNGAVRLGLARNVRYQQRFADFGGRWMPRAIELSLDVRLPIGNTQYRIEQLAELSGFRFDEGQRPAGLGEYRIVVADSADRADSATWSDARAIPLTPVERAAFVRIDSIRNAPKGVRRRVALAVAGALELLGEPDRLHFNRVDGLYAGFARSWPMPDMEPSVKLGVSNHAERWQYRVGDRVRLSESRRTWVGAALHDETMSRTTLTSPGYNPTLRALISSSDPLDYYQERGLVASFTTKLVNFVRLDGGYRDVRQSSLARAIDAPPVRLGGARPLRDNERIDEGRLRALSAAVSYDSRPLVRQGGRDLRLGAPRFSRLSVESELSPGRGLGSDFDYARWLVRLDRRQQSFGLGVTTVLATGGLGTGALPPQRWLGVDGGAQVLELQASPFSTLLDTSFSAPRAAVLSVQHEFDRLLFTRGDLPVLRRIPFTFTVRASAFWTGGDRGGRAGEGLTSPYQEAGFSLGNLTPFIAPFNLSARFAWQLSRYPTTPFRFSVGLGG